MEMIFSYASQKGHYTNRYGFLWCSDQRFDALRRGFEAVNGMQMADPIIIPGGVKNLVEPKFPRDRDFILEQIELLKTHGFQTLYIMAHNECAACGGNTDPAFYEAMLRSAREIINTRIPHFEVKPVFADFDGLYLVP